MRRDILDWQGNIVGQLEGPDDMSEARWAECLAPYAIAPAAAPTPKEKDYQRFLRRASVRNRIIAEMGAENVERVRNGTWSEIDLFSLTEDDELKHVLDDVNTLSYEMAIVKIAALTNPLITDSIKSEWTAKLQRFLYLD
jgi:muconolactone delta-isomerase